MPRRHFESEVNAPRMGTQVTEGSIAYPIKHCHKTAIANQGRKPRAILADTGELETIENLRTNVFCHWGKACHYLPNQPNI